MFTNYFKTAFRNLQRSKVYSFINIAGLALSFAAVWLIIIFVANELNYDNYHVNKDRIYRLASHGQWGDEKFDVTGTSGRMAEVLQKDFPEVEKVARIDPEGGGIVRYGDKRIKDNAIFFTDASFFNMFTYHFLAGGTNALNKPNTIVLTQSLAAKLFGHAEDAINQTVYLDNNPGVVTGIIEDVPQNSHFTFNALRSMPENYEDDWGSLSIYTYVLLKKGADVNRLQAKMPAFVDKYFTQKVGDIHYKIELQPLLSIHLHSHLSYELGENRDVKYINILSLVGFLILLIAFINYINITTARASVRLREVAVRKIVGSSRRSLVHLFLSESIITILAAACISVLLVSLAMPMFNSVTGKSLLVWYFGVGNSVAALLCISLLTALLGGLYPAFFLSRFKTIPALKNQLGDVKGQEMFRKSLVVFQFAVTVVMITASLIVYLQINYVSNKYLGFNKTGMLTFHIDNRDVRNEVPALRMALLQSPLVKDVATAGNPIGNNDIGMMDYSVEKNGVMDTHSNLAYGLTIDEYFIPAMQIRMLEGRNFKKEISSDSSTAIVNEAFIKKQGWQTGVGKKISRGPNADGKTNDITIIGVIHDYHIYSLQHKIEPLIMQLPQKAKDKDNMYVRVAGRNVSQALLFIENTFKKFDASSPFDYHFLDTNFIAQYHDEERQGQVLLSFALLTICIACLGLFGLITFTVSQRVKEIGIRKVLGASVAGLVSLLTKALLKIVVIAMLIALPVSWLVINQWLQSFAYRITISWWMFALAGGVAVVMAILTVSFQAIKAAIANPVKSLRTE